MTTDLGHQTVQRIVRASDPLQSMQDINQNFPSIVSYLSRMKVYFVWFSDIWHLSPKLLTNILMELWCTIAWWFCSRWNNCKPADDPTWQVFNGNQRCFSQCRRYWPLYVIFFPPCWYCLNYDDEIFCSLYIMFARVMWFKVTVALSSLPYETIAIW